MDVRQLVAGLDADQREAVTSDAGPLAIIAAAGSGKTTVLTRRIAYRIRTEAAEASHTLALTFTRDAASEMKRRLRRLELRDPIEAGTFHGVALRLLRDHALTLNVAPPQIASDRLRLIRECLTELRLDLVPFLALADIDWARARLVPADGYEAANRLHRRRSAIPVRRFAEVAAAYERLKRRRGVVDFDDLLERSTRDMATDRTFADVVRWRFRHFYVDEAQDLNPLQHQLLEAWRGGRPDICLVGDPRQAIYGWNGADHTTLAEVETRYPGVTVISLTTNYRCTPQVVRAAAAVLAAAEQHDDTRADRPDGARVTVRQFATDADEAAGVAQHVRLAMNHAPGRDIAVLARTNEQLSELQRVLGRHGVPTERSVGRSPLEVALGAAYRTGGREQLATWTETAFAHADEATRRVAEEADRYLSSGQSGTFRGWVDARNPFEDLMLPDRADAVAVLTFHAAKGREWPIVMVTGAEVGLVPHSSATTPAQRAEEARLLYVALTRAERDLTITYALRRKDSPTRRSPWLDAIEETAAPDIAVAPPSRPERQAAVDPLGDLRAWRAVVARAAGVPEQAVCNDRILATLLADPPADTDALASRLGMSRTAAARLRPPPGPIPLVPELRSPSSRAVRAAQA